MTEKNVRITERFFDNHYINPPAAGGIEQPKDKEKPGKESHERRTSPRYAGSPDK